MNDDGSFASIEDAARAYAAATEEPAIETPGDAALPEAPGETRDEDGDMGPTADPDEMDADDEPGDAEGEDDDGSQDQDGPLLADDARVRLQDGTVTTIGELRKGSLRQADYTRKQMALAEEKRAVEARLRDHEAEQQRVGSLDAELQRQRETIAAFAGMLSPREPDLAMLDPASDRYDPAGFQLQKAVAERQREEVMRLQADHMAHLGRRRAEQEQAFAGRIERERELLLEKAPELADPARYQRFWQDAVEAGRDYGFTAEEWGSVVNHASYLVMKDALAYRRIKAKKAEARAKAEGRPPLIQGGRRRGPGEARQQEARSAMERLGKTGSLRDGVAAYLALEKG